MAGIVVVMGCLLAIAPAACAEVIVVAAADSSAQAKTAARFVCDGEGDQDEINEAVRALPPEGGLVLLEAGTYDIRRVPGKLGGVLIERSHVTLAGRGEATRLILAPGQETNVIRIIGSGVGHVTVRDLYVDANRDGNPLGEGDPNVSHARFEFCGIKAHFREPGGPEGETCHHVTVENCRVLNARRLGIMLEGRCMRVLHNVLGNAGSDVVEILTGPGLIHGNYVEITGQTHVALGTDRGDSIVMSDNIVHVREGGALDIAFRSWANSKRHTITGNVVTVDTGGLCSQAIDARGSHTTISGNCIQGPDAENRTRLTISGSYAVMTGNTLENAVIEINDQTGGEGPIIVRDNILDKSLLDYKAGLLQTDIPR